MPGTIRVSVLEAVDLPEVITDGAVRKDVTAKVTLGPKLFKTQPGVADGGKIASWNSDFAFPVMNLRDKLEVSICDSEDHSMTQTAIEIPSIIQKGSRDEFVALNKGGRIHLRMSFVLSEEERKKIETMRFAALKRKEAAERPKKTVILQPVTPEKERKKPPVSTVAIVEVDVSTTEPSKESSDGRKDTIITGAATILADKTMDSPTQGDKKTSTPKRASPKPMFNHAKAIGAPPSAKKTVKKPSAAVADSSTDELKTDIDDAPRVEENTSEYTKPAPSVETAVPVNSTTSEAELATKAVNNITPGEVVEVPRNAGLVNEPVSSSTAEETPEVRRSALNITTPVDTSIRDFSWGDEFRATKSSDLQSDEVVGNTDGPEIKAADQAAPPPTKVDSGIEVGRDSKLDDASANSEEESSSLMMASDNQQAARSSFSGPLTSFSGPLTSFSGPLTSMRTVKSRVKRTLSRVSSMRRSTSLTRSSAQVPVVWVQEAVRRAMSNVKGCYGYNGAAVHH